MHDLNTGSTVARAGREGTPNESERIDHGRSVQVEEERLAVVSEGAWIRHRLQPVGIGRRLIRTPVPYFVA